MPDETNGLIERTAALLRQSGPPRSEGRLGGDYTRSRSQDGRAPHPEGAARLGRSGPLAPGDADLRPMPAPVVVDQEEWRLQRLVRMVLLHRFTLIATTLLCFTVAAAVIFSLTPRYTAEAIIAVGNRAPSVTTGIEATVEGNVVQVPQDAAVVVNTQVGYLRSRPVAERAMDYLNLWNLPEFDPRPRGPVAALRSWTKAAIARFRGFVSRRRGEDRANAAVEAAAVRRERAVDIFLSKLTVSPQTTSQIITVQFEDAAPKLAATAANAVADQYIARQIEVASGAAQQATEGLEQAVAKLRQRVAQSNQAYENYRGTFETQNGRELLGKETEEASKELATAQVARQVLETRLTALQRLSGRDPTNEATSEVTESRVMQTLHEQTAVLQGRLAELSTTFGDANPQVQQVRAALTRVHGLMRAEVARQTRALETDLRAAVAKEAALRQSLAATRTVSALSSGGQAKLDALKVEAESNQAVLNAFLTHLHEADISAKLLQRANAEIVAPASVPVTPSFPKTALLLVLAAIGSAIAGFAAAVSRERAAPTFRSSEEIELETGIRALALVPLLENLRGPPEVVLASPASLYGEAIRTLYTMLPMRQRLKMFVVTSARGGDGKTTLAASLALMAARAGRRVLLADADLCSAGASRMFGLSGHEGLAELIAGGKQFSEVVATAGADPNFHFLAAGAPDLLLAARSALESGLGVLRRLGEEYDLIVIDSPPVLAVADAMALSAQADATLFCVRWGSTPRSAVKLGLKRLHVAAQGVAVGAVLTMVDARAHSRSGYEDSAFYAKDLVHYYGPR
jgi:polysaccharide biosynthesis transport protein